MKKIKNIVVPIDFSLTSLNAYHYANKLAEIIGATITLIHVEDYFMSAPELAVGPLSEFEINHIAQKSMSSFIKEGETDNDNVLVRTKIKTKILQGDIVSKIVEQSERNDVDMIVIGMAGTQDFFSKVIGSMSIRIASKAFCPVILVPHNVRWQRIERMMYTSNYHTATPMMIRKLLKFGISLKAAIHFVHFDSLNPETEKSITKIIWDELFTLADPAISYKIQTISGSDKVKKLNQYAEYNKINLMVFVSQERSFWERLLHHSITESIALTTDKPIMVMHLHDIQQLQI